jgi:uncharacterized phage-associated protein
MKNGLVFRSDKAVQAINFFVTKYGSFITMIDVLKLIHAVDRYHLRKYGRPVIGDNYVAMKYGPVPSSTKDLIQAEPWKSDYAEKYIEYNPIDYSIISLKAVDYEVFSDSDLEVFDFIFNKLKNRIGIKDKNKRLSKRSHEYKEWQKLKSRVEKEKCVPINYDDFFDEDNIDDKLTNTELEKSKALFKENCSKNNIWERVVPC